MKTNYHKYTKLENMMCNIVFEGHKEVWKAIEEIKDPFKRCEERNLLAKATKKISENN